MGIDLPVKVWIIFTNKFLKIPLKMLEKLKKS